MTTSNETNKKSTIVAFEVFDCDILEGVNVEYYHCIFFDCQFTGSSNIYYGCRFQNTFNQPIHFVNRSKYVRCLFCVEDYKD